MTYDPDKFRAAQSRRIGTIPSGPITLTTIVTQMIANHKETGQHFAVIPEGDKSRIQAAAKRYGYKWTFHKFVKGRYKITLRRE